MLKNRFFPFVLQVAQVIESTLALIFILYKRYKPIWPYFRRVIWSIENPLLCKFIHINCKQWPFLIRAANHLNHAIWSIIVTDFVQSFSNFKKQKHELPSKLSYKLRLKRHLLCSSRNSIQNRSLSFHFIVNRRFVYSLLCLLCCFYWCILGDECEALHLKLNAIK